GGELGAEVKYTGEWPGTAMTLGSDGFYTYTVNQSMVYAIFTDGSASGTLQTDDIQNITASTCYELSSEQHENMLGAMVYDAIETACPEPVSIIETEAVELNIYPNPTNDYINVDCAEEISEVVISALNGSEVIRTKSTYIDLSSLNPSMYFVNIMLQNGDVLVSKVIRK
ncbi:MAG: starch-binding protein, partial [Paludibacteraceae bacterium]|nr:starch-binding protein [Paludibacteraceae bacterium]